MKLGLEGGQLRFLSRDDVEKIHQTSLRILEEIGIKSSSKIILDFFKKEGAETDEKTGLIKIPENLVKDSLKKAPSKVVIYGYNPKNAIVLENKRIYFGLGGTPTPYILDHVTGEIRRPTKEDVIKATRLGEYLSEMDFIMTIAGAFDVPYELEYIHEWEVLLTYTTKPIVYSAPGLFNTNKVIEMGRVMKGDRLEKEPIFGVYVEMPSPLMFHTTNENIFSLAKNGIPIVVGQIPQLGATAPITYAGAVALSNAENLAALTLAELIKPGAPFVLGAYVAPLDMRTGRCAYGAPEFAMGNIANAALAEFYNLPTFGWGGCSDSKLPDAQAGAEVMMNSLVAALSGICLIHDCGYLAGGSIGSLEMAVISNEVVGMVKRIVRGIDVNEETLAFDVIRDVGPGGHFLSHKHTLKHLPSLYVSRLFSRESEVKWMKMGKKDVRIKAREEVNKILSQPVTIDKSLSEEIKKIVKKAEEEVLKKR
ncbi:MAG: trimethylamine methyltransferase family protein [Candidatus Bathyarchaeia archaeon]